MIRTKLQAARLDMRGSPSATVLAKRAGLSMGQVSQIERGEVRPGSKARSKLARALNLTPPQFDTLWRLDREAFLLRELEAVRGELDGSAIVRPKSAGAR